jgi:hypothetical protein
MLLNMFFDCSLVSIVSALYASVRSPYLSMAVPSIRKKTARNGKLICHDFSTRRYAIVYAEIELAVVTLERLMN